MRDQLADEKPEDLPSLVEQMTRVSALAAGRRGGKAALPIDAASPYFAHMRLRTEGKERRAARASRTSDISSAGAASSIAPPACRSSTGATRPVSQVYYRYDEGDDYDEEVAGGTLRGVVEARRNVTIAGGKLRRIGCPQGTFVASGEGEWFELDGDEVALLAGGQGTAARPPRPGPPQPRGRRRMEPARAASDANKALPEIAALIDRAQFDLITEPGTGLVVIQGGAGSGKTTVALHRIAYLVFNDVKNFKPSRCLFVVPSEALARYVAGVLPALGVQGVPVTTFRSWARNLRKRLVPSAPDRYAEDTPTAVARLKKHPALLTPGRARRRRGAGSGAARAGRAAGRARRARPGCSRRGTRTRNRAAGAAGARHAARRSSAAAWTCRRRRRTRAEQALRKIQARLGDVRRILFELLTDRGRLEALRGDGGARAGRRARARRAGALVHGAARGRAARPSSRASTRIACSRSTACRSRTARGDGGARAAARRGGRRAALAPLPARARRAHARRRRAAGLRPHRARRGAGSVGRRR